MLVDLSHDVVHGMTTYRGLPGPIVSAHLTHEASRGRYAAGTEFHIGRIEMLANTGTYLDAPFHRYRQGKDVAELPPAWGARTTSPGRSATHASGSSATSLPCRYRWKGASR